MEPGAVLPPSQVPTNCLYPEAAQSNPYPTSNFLRIHLNIILPFTPWSPKWPLSLRFPHQNPVYASPLPHTRYIPRPSHPRREAGTEFKTGGITLSAMFTTFGTTAIFTSFGPLKDGLRGRHFRSDDVVNGSAHDWLAQQPSVLVRRNLCLRDGVQNVASTTWKINVIVLSVFLK